MTSKTALSRFVYQAASVDGKTVRGSLTAEDVAAARLRLKEQQLFPIDLREASGKSTIRWRGARKWTTFFTRHLADLLESGVELDRALGTLTRLAPPSWQTLLTSVRAEVQGGATLANALSQYPNLFPPAYLGLVRAGEASGTLEPVLHRLANSREEEEEVRQFVRTALVYPAIVASASLLAGGFMVGFVVPRFTSLYSQFRQALPWPTRIVLGAEKLLSTTWPVWLVLAVLVPVTFWQWYKRFPTAREGVATLARRVPGVGSVLRNMQVSQLCRTLAMLLGSGLTLSRSLGVLVESEASPQQRSRIKAVKTEVEAGHKLAETLSQQGLLPELAAEMVAVGEETASLETAFTRVGTMYGNLAKESTRRLLSLLEPLLILAVASLVGLVMAAVLLPVLSLPTVGF